MNDSRTVLPYHLYMGFSVANFYLSSRLCALFL